MRAAPLSHRTLADQPFDVLEAAMVTGELAPGPRVREVAPAEMFGISRGPLRETLQRLEGRKLVERTPCTAMRVVELSPNDIPENLFVREAPEAGRGARGVRAKRRSGEHKKKDRGEPPR